jgi:hypothetical protein
VSRIGRVEAAEGAFAATRGSCTAACRTDPRCKRTFEQETYLSSFAMNYCDSFRIALEPGRHFSDRQRKQGERGRVMVWEWVPGHSVVHTLRRVGILMQGTPGFSLSMSCARSQIPDPPLFSVSRVDESKNVTPAIAVGTGPTGRGPAHAADERCSGRPELT